MTDLNPMNAILNNAELLERARARIPGGVNSPVRAFNGVGGEPLCSSSAPRAPAFSTSTWARLHRLRGLLGPHDRRPRTPGHHRRRGAAGGERGLSYGAPSPGEVTMAERLCDLVEPAWTWCAW